MKIHDLWHYARQAHAQDLVLLEMIDKVLLEMHKTPDRKEAHRLYNRWRNIESMAKMDGDTETEKNAANAAEVYAHLYKKLKTKEEA